MKVLCDLIDCSSPGYSVHGILQARTLEWDPSPGDLSDPGIELRSLALQAYSLLSEPPGKPSPDGCGSIFPAKIVETLEEVVLS